MEDRIRIRKINWERIYLHIHLEGTIEKTDQFFIEEESNKNLRYPLKCMKDEICINITCVSGATGEEMLRTGKWRLFLLGEAGVKEQIPLDQGVLGELEDLDKVFPYWQGVYAYILTFELEEAGGSFSCIIKTAYMRKNNKPRKEYISLEAAGMLQMAKKTVVLAVEKAYQGLYKMLAAFRRKDGRHILLMSETKNQLAGNLKTIDNRLKERGLDRKVIISYSFHETVNLSSVSVAIYWFKLIFRLAKQDFVLIDDYAPVFKALTLSRKTKLIQVWHAGLGFKSVGYSRFGKENSPRPLTSGHRKYDHVVVGSENLIPVYQEVFGISRDKFLPYGIPRVDEFLNKRKIEDCRRRFFDKHQCLRYKKRIVFAPTYRGGGQADAYYPYDKLDLERLYDICGQEYVFLFKMHPFVTEPPVIPEQMGERIFDLSDENINEILHVCDILITDYSSVIYEFVLLDKPILFYAFDKEQYRLTRGFHWDFDQYAPGEICMDFDSLMLCLKAKDSGEARRALFRDFGYDYIDTHAADRLIDRVLIKEACDQ